MPATVIGWGRTTNDQDKFQEDFIVKKAGSTVLQQVKVPIKSQQSCQDVPEFKFNGLKFDKRFCAGGEKGIFFDNRLLFQMDLTLHMVIYSSC